MIKAPTLHSLRRSRFLALLVSLIFTMVISPFLDDSRLHEAFLVLLLALIMVTAIHATSSRRGNRLVALVLGVPWVAVSLWSLVWHGVEPTVGSSLLFAVFGFFTIGTVLSSVISAEDVDFDILLGAAAVYLMLGIVWTSTYLVILQLDPGSFSLIHGEARPYFHQLLYFSMTTLTTLGYGDVTPLSPFAQIWATLEAVTGTLYMALLVARLVGMYQSRRPRRKKMTWSISMGGNDRD